MHLIYEKLQKFQNKYLTGQANYKHPPSYIIISVYTAPLMLEMR